ncbi:MAG: hypothetical protein JO305_04000 [Alphaproteobacteria bacterium]|nr:hypothetical protein [Alphaproteobacteria bacterium]
MSRSAQERLAEALILAEDPNGAGKIRAAEIRDLYRNAASGAAAGARPGPQHAAQELTPFRLFCVPLEDMLGDEPLPSDSTRISRAVVAACWAVIEERIAPARREAVASELAGLAAAETDPDRSADRVDAVGREWWGDCEAALTTAIEDTRTGRSRALADRMPRRLFEHAETIAAALRVAGPIQRLKHLLGDPPIARLTAAQKEALRGEMLSLVRRGGADPRVAVHVVAHRLRNPAELFLLTAGIDLGQASPHGRRLTAARETLILSVAAEHVAALDQLVESRSGLAGAVDLVEVAAALLGAGIRLDRHGASTEYLREIGRQQEAVAARLRSAILPALRAEIWTAWAEPAAVPPDDKTVLAAEAAARALARLLRSAALVGAEAVLRPLVGTVLETIEAALADTSARLADEGADETRQRDAAALVNAVRMIEVLAGSDRAFAALSDHQQLLDRAWANCRPRA